MAKKVSVSAIIFGAVGLVAEFLRVSPAEPCGWYGTVLLSSGLVAQSILESRK
jgi:hypothetical protein